MRLPFIKLFFFLTLLLQIACTDCNLSECKEAGGTVQFKLLKDGQNALFGSAAFISKDSVTISINGQPAEPGIIGFNEISGTLAVYLTGPFPYIMEIKNFRKDTIIGTTEISDTDKCGCSSYRFTHITINGQNICQDGCNDIIVVEL